MALSLDIDVGDVIMIGDCSISLVKKTGRKARLSIEADKSIPVSFKPLSSNDHKGRKRETNS